MTPHIELSELDQHTLTVALHLERAGFVAAAAYLRKGIAALAGVNWADAKEVKHVAPADLFRRHRGSLPPAPPTPQPPSHQPTIRPDQITS